MTREEALSELSPLYRTAVTLVEAGVNDDARLADALGVPTQSVPALVQLADAKLTRAMARDVEGEAK